MVNFYGFHVGYTKNPMDRKKVHHVRSRPCLGDPKTWIALTTSPVVPLLPRAIARMVGTKPVKIFFVSTGRLPETNSFLTGFLEGFP